MYLIDDYFKKVINIQRFIPLKNDAYHIKFYLDFESIRQLIQLAHSFFIKNWYRIWSKRSQLRLKKSKILSEIRVKVVYALPEKQYLLDVTLQEGASVEEAVIISGLLEICQDIDLAKNKVGIYSDLVNLSDIVKDGDRVEIYRPLLADPKEIRRKRIKKGINQFNRRSTDAK